MPTWAVVNEKTEQYLGERGAVGAVASHPSAPGYVWTVWGACLSGTEPTKEQAKKAVEKHCGEREA